MNNNDLIKYLFTFKDEKYLEFNKKIINTPSNMIGIRTPIIKRIAKELSKDYKKSLSIINTNYYEEFTLEGFIISYIKDINDFDYYFDLFVPKIDNWATCDMCIGAMKQLGKDEKYFDKAKEFIETGKEFTIRVGYLIMMDYYLDNNHIDEILDILNKKNEEFYYVKMVKAWLISVAYIQYKDKIINFLKRNSLDDFTHNKSIQKIIELLRVEKFDKDYLKSFKRKKRF